MTPERRQEIKTLHKMYSENLAHQPQHAVNVLVDCVRDLSIDNDALTAEIATLRTRLDALVTAGEKVGVDVSRRLRVLADWLDREDKRLGYKDNSVQ